MKRRIKIFIVPEGDCSLNQLRAKADQWCNDKGIAIVKEKSCIAENSLGIPCNVVIIYYRK